MPDPTTSPTAAPTEEEYQAARAAAERDEQVELDTVEAANTDGVDPASIVEVDPGDGVLEEWPGGIWNWLMDRARRSGEELTDRVVKVHPDPRGGVLGDDAHPASGATASAESVEAACAAVEVAHTRVGDDPHAASPWEWEDRAASTGDDEADG
jgi:hypothetical protein